MHELPNMVTAPDAPLALRIGAWVFNPDAVFMPLAAAFLAVLFARDLREAETRAGRGVLMPVLAVWAGGVLGARLYGLVQPMYTGDPVLAHGAWAELRFGSLGWMWGVLIAAPFYGWVSRRGGLLFADAVVPGLCASLAVARLACIFQGCCRGWTFPALPVQPLRDTWPLMDIAALAGVLFLVRWRQRHALPPGSALTSFLVVYGLARFLLEFGKDTYHLAGPFTWGHLLAGAATLTGLAGAAALRAGRVRGTRAGQSPG